MKLFTTTSILAIATTLVAATVGSTILHGNNATAAIQNITNFATTSTDRSLIAKGESTPLAKQLQGKPVVVDIYASWCPGCKNIAPTLSQLRQQYIGKVNFVMGK
jgi:thiol-disulfide isomerase/thioredoxin